MSEYESKVALAANALRDRDNHPMPKSVTTPEAFYKVMAKAALVAVGLSDLLDRLESAERELEALQSISEKDVRVTSRVESPKTRTVHEEARGSMTTEEHSPGVSAADNSVTEHDRVDDATSIDALAARVSRLENAQYSPEALGVAARLSRLPELEQLQQISVKTFEGLSILVALLDDLVRRVDTIGAQQSPESLDTLQAEIAKLTKTLKRQRKK